MRISVLGPLELDKATAPLGTRDRVVLTALAMNPGELLTPEQLADAVWGDKPPASWAKNVQGCVSRLRKRLGPDAIETAAHGYRLRIPADNVDAVEFARSAHRVSELMTLKEYEHARYVAVRTLELWRGRPLADLEHWGAGASEARRLYELRSDLEELVVEASLAAGHHREVLAQASAMVEAAPLRERRWSLLARAQYQTGDQNQALRTLRSVRTVLQRELGLDPGPELVALEQAILRQAPELRVEQATDPDDTISPYLGLTPYGENDSEAFFGRDGEVRACLDRLQTVPLLAVVGPSGSGKSSLVRAGVVPALRRGGSDVRVISPGRHPMDALTSARRRRTSVLVVDQAEEAFSLCSDEEERAMFFGALVEHTDRGRVVIALRADHTGGLARNPALAALVERGLLLLGAMPPESLRATIESPAHRHGLLIEPGLVDLLVREVEGEPGALPLLSHALRETWLRREGRTLTVAGYQASGGIRGAVAQSAEHLYSQVAEGERPRLRELVLRLVIPGPSGQPLRGRLPRRQVVVDDGQERLVDRMVAARLVTSDDGAIELAHEALVRAWPRLQSWLEDDQEGQRTRHRLMQAAEDWSALGHQDSELYRGARLVTVREWVATSDPQLSDDEQRFLDASAELAAAEERSAAELARTRGRMVRRLRIALAGASVLLVLALIAGFVAVGQTHRANRSAVSADAGRLGAQALVTDDITKSLLMAVAAARLDPSSQTEQNLDAALAQHQQLFRSVTVPGRSPLSQLEVSPDGQTLGVVDRSHHIWTYDARTLKPIDDTQVGRSQPSNFDTPLAYDPTGHSVAVGAAPGRRGLVILLDPHTLKPLPRQLEGWPDRWAEVVGLAYSADGRFLAVSLTFPNGREGSESSPGAEPVQTGGVLVWNLRDLARRPRRIPLHRDFFFDPVALSRDGGVLYLAGSRSAYDLRTGRWLRQHSSGYSTAVAIAPSGRLLAGTFGDFSAPDVSLVDARSGRVLGRLKGYTGDVSQVAFSPNGRNLAVLTDDGHAAVWDVASGDLLDTLDDGTQLADGLGWSADGSTLLTTTADSREIHAWDLSGFRDYVPLVHIRYRPGVGGGVLWSSPHGDAVAVGANTTPAASLWIINVRRGTTSRRKLTRPAYISSAGAFSSDGRRFAAGYQDGWVQVFSQARSRPVIQRHVTSGSVSQLAYTADGRRLAVLDDAGDVQLVSSATLEPAGSEVHLPRTRTYDFAVGPDNLRAFVFGGPPIYRVGPLYPLAERWWLVDLASGRILQHGTMDFSAEYAAFSPRGDRVALAGDGGEVELLDLTTGRPVGPPVVGNKGENVWVAFNDSGSRFAAASDAGEVSLWDGRDGRLLGTTTLRSQGNSVAAFRPDGTLIVGTSGGVMYRWDPSPEHAIAFACQAAGRDMTRAEWNQVLPDQPYRPVCPAPG